MVSNQGHNIIRRKHVGFNRKPARNVMESRKRLLNYKPSGIVPLRFTMVSNQGRNIIHRKHVGITENLLEM